jgi:hypothetical protein
MISTKIQIWTVLYVAMLAVKTQSFQSLAGEFFKWHMPQVLSSFQADGKSIAATAIFSKSPGIKRYSPSTSTLPLPTGSFISSISQHNQSKPNA